MPLPFPSRGLYAITAESGDLETLLTRVRKVLEGGAQVVQLRDKHRWFDAKDAVRLLTLCHQFGAPLIVNDDIPLACEIGADGVHLGKDDADLAEARKQLGKDAIIGVSCYADLDRASGAEKGGATYVAFGAFFPSISKPHATRAPIGILKQAQKLLSCPIAAIGGITPDNGHQLILAGADLLAVIGSVFEQDDPRQASARFQRLFSDVNHG